MSLWYSQGGARYRDKGKFHQRPRTGVARSGQTKYRDWSYDFTSHQTGTSVKRMTYGVTIADSNDNRVEYLQGFSSLDQAASAACSWIDEILKKINKRVPIAPLGNIPKFPNAAINQEK